MSAKAKDPYTRLFQPNIPLSVNTDPRIDLTPSDLVASGYIVRPHHFAGFWCWWKRIEGGGEEFGEPRLDLEAVYASARHHEGLFLGPPHKDDGLLSYFNDINRRELERRANAQSK